MSTLLITIPDFTSHVLPILPVAEALVKRGHRVLVHVRPHHADKVRATGAEFVPMSEHCEVKYQIDHNPVQIPWWLPAPVHGLWRFRQGVLAMIPCMVAELETLIQQEQVDLLMGDYIGCGAAYAAERLGIPFATFSVTWTMTYTAAGLPVFFSLPLPPRFVHKLINFIFPLHRLRQQLGLPQRPQPSPAEMLSTIVSDQLHLVATHKGFVPSVELQKNQVFIGPTDFHASRQSDTSPFGKSLAPETVLVSTTTSAKLDDNQFRHVVESVAQMGLPVLASVGNMADVPSELQDMGDNVQLSAVPHEEVFPYVSAVITHGGAGSVGRALRLGTPMLIIPDFGDQIHTGRRAAKLGLAYHLPKKEATPEAIQSSLTALLQDQALHARIKALSAEIQAMGCDDVAADAIEDLLAQGQPINHPAPAVAAV